MKTRGLVAVLLLLTGLQSALAQKLKLYLSDKQVVEYSVEKVDSLVFTEDTADASDSHEWVDLGLPSGTLWATCNVGANSPEEYGDYFAWGETEPKSDYNWSTYKYCKGSIDTMTKYCTNSDYGTVDNKTELEPSDDAATANWGSNWQMPSTKQFEELINSSYTTTTWTTMNGVYGRKITSKSNGNSIFLPAAGYRKGTSLNDAGSYGDYWSRSLLITSGSYNASYLHFHSSGIYASPDIYRYFGQSVRPVRVNDRTVAVSNIELSRTELSVKVGETTQLSATVLPENATNKDVKWASSNSDVATVDETGKVTVVAGGTCMVICSATDGSGVKAECQVTVLNGNSGTLDGHVYVDLGLPSGTLWATCNVGANSPEEYGDYFAWGETEPKNDYSWSTYKYCKGSSTTMTKYCTNSSRGTVDNKTELEPSDDAATVNWGSEWQMPSDEQIEELINRSYTTTTWTTMNGVKGRMITSKSNGYSIFLPAADWRKGTILNNLSGYGKYWSRSLLESYSSGAYGLLFDSNGIYASSDNYRSYGLSVRPVRLEKCIPVSKIELSQTELSVKVGETTQLLATVLPDNAKNKNLKWASSNTDIATVDETGKVTSVAGGICTITCSAADGSGVKAECQVTVLNGNSGTLDGHVYVDLGLPSGTLWATCNVGANSPEEYGDYFAWGETEPKTTYNWSTYKHCKGTETTMTKYCTYSSYGTVDNKTELEPSDDAATVNWGSEWQMPSDEQLEELINSSYTTTTWTTMNGVKGRMITSNSNGNSIFLPAAGYCLDSSLIYAGSDGDYWSRSLYTSLTYYVCSLKFHSGNIYTHKNYREYGLSVRPVRVIAVSNIELSQTELSVKVGETTQLSATVLPDNATNKNLKWESSNAYVATVDETGEVTALTVGTCTITCSATDGSGVKAECQVTVSEFHEYIDLGLPSGTLWATCNVGANSPEEYGDYFAWGETEPKTDYSWDTYKYCKGTDDSLTKYCTDSDYGTVDNKTELEPSDDAATVNWGSEWQMPSDEQLKELINSSYTTTTWTTMNGVKGRMITSNSNGNSIFLPAAGYRFGTSLYEAGSDGYCWSRSLDTSFSPSAYYLHFYSSDIDTYSSSRCCGCCVRPVRVKK